MAHLIIAPVILPLTVSALMLLLDEQRRRLKAAISVATVIALIAIALTLVHAAALPDASGRSPSYAYLLGNWQAPFGIVMVADRLSAMMLLLASVLGLFALLFSLARWDRAGPRFHVLFMLLLMGVNGAFSTGDLFNLFVFFEVLLAASYGLVLHGSGEARVKAGLHYIAINLTASLLFLLGVSLVYGVAGTLNMADLAQKIAAIDASNRTLFEAGCALLGTAFLIKAGMWPLGFWLPSTYAASSAPAAALFAIMTKVGIYVVLRLSLLLFGVDAGASADFGATWLLWGGLATLGFGTVGVLSSQSLGRIAGFCVFISSGTLLAAIGVGSPAVLAGGLFYLVSSTLAIGAFFLLVELLERGRHDAAATLAEPVFGDEYRDPFESGSPEEVGVLLPATVALLGWAFILCVLLLAGLPPLPGFLGKLAIMAGLLKSADSIATSSWLLIAALSLSSLATLVALVRAESSGSGCPARRRRPRCAAWSSPRSQGCWARAH